MSEARLEREGVALAYSDEGHGEPPLVLVHGLACHRGFWAPQIRHFASRHRVVAPDLRGHGDSDAPQQPYSIGSFADDLAWTFAQLNIDRPIVVGHSMGGMAALALAATHPGQVGAIVLIDSVLLPAGGRSGLVAELAAGLRSGDAEATLRGYYGSFFGPHDSPQRKAWVLDEAVRTAPYVTASALEESVRSWDDAEALARCQVPVLYLDAGTENANLARATELCPQMVLARTVGSGHFSPVEVPDQVNAMLERFIAMCR